MNNLYRNIAILNLNNGRYKNGTFYAPAKSPGRFG